MNNSNDTGGAFSSDETRLPYVAPQLVVLEVDQTETGSAGAFEASNCNFVPQSVLQAPDDVCS